MTFEEIFGHAASGHLAGSLEGAGPLGAHLGRNPEGDVHELAQVEVVGGVRLVVAQA